MNTAATNKPNTPTRWLAVAILGIGASFWLVFGLIPLAIAYFTAERIEWSTLGQIGDNFGAANALFSGLAMIAAIYAVIQGQHMLRIQQREFELTREEMTRSREEMKRSADAQAETVREQKRLIDSQLMLSIMERVSHPDVKAAVAELAAHERHSAERLDALERNLSGRGNALDRELADGGFRGHIMRHVDAVNRPLGRIYRMYQRGVVDEEMLRLVIDDETTGVFLRVADRMARAQGDDSLDGLRTVLARV
jgi:hypothetical protein